ncbi:MAG: GDP-mannose 4,6-dehydratase [Candidatus Hydrogenedentota bacterium]|nr:MAG: GDP-mannose 4,6-dehydratase [Candidatus Hydrogenedentota bacterium]
MRVLITGIAGFAGSHLAELLLKDGEEVFGTVLPEESTRNTEPFGSQLKLFPCDLRDADAADRLVEQVRPEAIYHLAALTFIPDSISDPRLTFDTNLYGTLNLFEAAKKLAPRARVLFVGSADEYGLVKEDELPITERNPLRPTNPYSVSKVSASMLAYQYGLSGRMHIVRVRPFNHTGPRQSSQFVCSDFTRQIVEAERGQRAPEIQVGNLRPKRDFTDVRDVVRAYRDILRHGKPCEVYNICSGRSVAISEILDMLLSISGQQFRIVECPERARQTDIEEIRGDFSKIEKAAAWRPTIPLMETLRDMIEYWRGIS